jgi:hypothetical protein
MQPQTSQPIREGPSRHRRLDTAAEFRQKLPYRIRGTYSPPSEEVVSLAPGGRSRSKCPPRRGERQVSGRYVVVACDQE